MPSNMLDLDVGFPALGGGESTEEKLASLHNYLFLLVEQLRYSMRNMDRSNFNTVGLERMGDWITQPLTVHLEESDGRMAELKVTADKLSQTVSGLDGAFSRMEQTVEGFTYLGQDGRVMISNGSIDLTGAIRWTDLESEVQSSINNRGISSATAKRIADEALKMLADGNYPDGTFITGTTLESPMIKGGYFLGGAYYDLTGVAKLELAYGEGSSAFPDLCFTDIETGNIPFAVSYRSSGGDDCISTLFLSGFPIMEVSSAHSIYDEAEVTAVGKWDFSIATVTGLRFE